MGENVTIMAYYPQYGNQPSMRHSSVADDAAIAAAFQAELDAENNLYSKPKENTMRDSEVARSFQAEENAKADGTFKVVSRNPMQYRVSPNYNDIERNIPGPKTGDTFKATAVRSKSGIAFIRINVAGAKLYLPCTSPDKKTALMQKVTGAGTGAAKAKPSGPQLIAQNATYKVVYKNGCCYRKSPSWGDRNTTATPAACGSVSSGNVIRGTDNVDYVNVAPGFYLPVATADKTITIMQLISSGSAPAAAAPARSAPAPARAPARAPAAAPAPDRRRETLSHNEAAGSMRDSEFARILQGQEESRAGVQPGAAAKLQTQRAKQVAPAAPAAAPAADWEAIKDAQGRTYYWNKATNETQWTKPAGGCPLNNDIQRISLSHDSGSTKKVSKPL